MSTLIEQFDYSKLRGKIKEIYGTQDAFAEDLGLGRVTLSQRLNNLSDFSQSEILCSCRLLSQNIGEIPVYFLLKKFRKMNKNCKIL